MEFVLLLVSTVLVMLCKYFKPFFEKGMKYCSALHTKTQDLVHTLFPSKSHSLPLVRQKLNHSLSFLSWFQLSLLPHTLSLFYKEAFLYRLL